MTATRERLPQVLIDGLGDATPKSEPLGCCQTQRETEARAANLAYERECGEASDPSVCRITRSGCFGQRLRLYVLGTRVMARDAATNAAATA